MGNGNWVLVYCVEGVKATAVEPLMPLLIEARRSGIGPAANAIVQLPEPELVSHQKSTFTSPFASPSRQLLEIGVLGAGPPTVDVDHPLPVERATAHAPEPEPVSHHISVFPSPFTSPMKHWFPTGVVGAGPFQVDVDQPLPVERTTDHVPEPELVSHHMSVLPSPLRSPVRHWFLTGIPGAGPLQVEVDHPLPVEIAICHVPEPEFI